MQKPHGHTLSSEDRAAISGSVLDVAAFYAATVLVCVVLALINSQSRSENSGQMLGPIASGSVDPLTSSMPLP